jgi:hypothetical protein
MSKIAKTAQQAAVNAEPTNKTADDNTVTALTEEEFVSMRLGGNQAEAQPEPTELPAESQPEPGAQPEPVVETEPEPEPEPEPVVEGEATPEEAEANSEDDVLAKLDDLSEAELTEMSQKLGSRAVARFGELTARRKAAEEKAAALEARLQRLEQGAEQNPLQPAPDLKDNPHTALKTVDELQAKAGEVNALIEWGEDVLFEASDHAPDDVVTQIEGKDVTKTEVRTMLKQARKSRDLYLPAQFRALQEGELATRLQDELKARAPKELPWLATEGESPVRERYEAILADPRLIALKEQAPPSVTAQLDYLLAHAANSLFGGAAAAGSAPDASKKKVQRAPQPGAVPNGSAAPGPNNGRAAQQQQIKNMEGQFHSTGSVDDFVSLRTQQLQAT